MRTIAIIGGGFCGTMTAVNLARLSDVPLKVLLINAGQPLGRGAAYGTKRPEHLLNVVARNMSALPDQRNHFVDWLRCRSDFADLPEVQLRETFVPRRIYGDYLRSLLLSCMQPMGAKPIVEVELVDGVVSTLESGGALLEITLTDGRTITADQVVLATGNEPPAPFPGVETLTGNSAWCSNPWTEWDQRLPPSAGRVVLLGTGLTMVDAVLTLMARGWSGEIVAISRNGMLPQSHFKGIEYTDYLASAPTTMPLAKAVELVEQHCKALRDMGENPATAVDRVRPYTQKLWEGFSAAEKREFVQKYATRWNVVRHRIAPSIHGQITEATTRGQLRIIKGSIVRLSASDAGVDVTVAEKSGGETVVQGSLVVNCTGPETAFSRSKEPLFQSLLKSGLARPDELDLGIDAGDDYSVCDKKGQLSPRLFAIGPLLKGKLWETTAVPELRGQAMRMAEILLDREAAVSAVAEYDIEYSI